MKISRFAVLAALLCAVAITGCSVFRFVNENQILAMGVIQQATTRFIETAPANGRTSRAAEVIRVASEIKAVAASDKTTIDGLRELALKQIAKAQLKVSDRLLANQVVEASVIALKEKVKRTQVDPSTGATVEVGTLDPDVKLAVDKLIDWIIQAAQLY
jgi:hypothetical protein